MATPYIGNNDYRGYLNYLGTQGDARAKTLLGFVGNDGGWDQSKSGVPLADPQGTKSYNQQLYSQWVNGLIGGGNAGGGAGGPSAQDKADEQAYWQDQLDAADRQLGRIPTQRQIGEQNISKQYQSAYDRLLGDKATTERDYNTKRTQTTEDNISAKNNIDTSVRNRNTGLQRLLGSRGAATSSAAQILAPYAAAKEGSLQRGQVQNAYGRNIQGLDTAWGDYQGDWENSVGDLAAQRDAQKNQLISGLSTTEAQLQEAKANAALQKAQAAGQSYTQARAARTPYTDRIGQLIGQIDALGANPVFNPKTAAFKAPDLASYTYDKYAAPTAGSGVDPNQAQGAGAYWTLLNGAKKKEAVA